MGASSSSKTLWRMTSILISRFIKEVRLAKEDAGTSNIVRVAMPEEFEDEIKMLEKKR